MSDDITCRLNVNSVPWVYSASLPASIVYSPYASFVNAFLFFAGFLGRAGDEDPMFSRYLRG